MKILLVTTPTCAESFDSSAILFMEPLALEYIGAGVVENHDVKLVDLRDPAEPGLKEVLESFQPDIFGCGAMTSEVNSAREICSQAKKICPGILTVLGGYHATILPQECFDENIDVVVIGEGVFPFKKICEYHEKKKSFQDIENIYYRQNGKMVFTFKQEYPELDQLPFPARELTAHLRHKYRNYLLLNKPMTFANMRASTGCFFNCKFCAVTRLRGRKLYTRSDEKIIEELETIKEPVIFWVDDEFILEPERMILLAKKIDKAGIKKYHVMCSRSDNVIKHPECIEEWAKIGLKAVYVGMESHRENDLKDMRKGTTLSKNEESIRILHQNNIMARAGFIVYPDFDKKEFKNLVKYVKKVKIELPSFSILTPLPGTDLYDEKKDQLITHNYNLFDMLHVVLPTKLPLKQFYKEFTWLTFKALSLKQKLRLVRHMDSEARKRLIANSKKSYQKMKSAYLLYD